MIAKAFLLEDNGRTRDKKPKWAQLHFRVKRPSRIAKVSMVKLSSLPNLTVEPLVFLFYAGYVTYQNVFTTGLYWKLCKQQAPLNSSIDCRHLKDTPDFETHIQTEAADWKIYISLSYTLPVIVAGPILGAYSDQHGRKINLMLALTGVMLYELGYLAELVFVSMPIWIFPIFGFVTSFSGFYGMVSPSCYAYLADNVANEDSLMLRYSILQVTRNIAEIAFGAVAGAILKTWSFAQTQAVSMGILTICFLYVTIVAVQKPPAEARRKNRSHDYVEPSEKAPLLQKQSGGSRVSMSQSGNVFTFPSTSEIPPKKQESIVRSTFGLFKSALVSFVRPREGRNRAYIWVTVLSFVLLNATQSGLHQVLTLFCLHGPLYWDASQIAYYNSLSSVAVLIGNLLMAVLLKKIFHLRETTILLISILSLTVKLVLIGLAQNSAMMLAAAIFGFAGDLVYPVCKALAVQFISQDELGRLYALFQLATDLALLVSHTLYNALYAATITVFPGFIFIVMAITVLVTFFAIGWIHIDRRREELKRII